MYKYIFNVIKKCKNYKDVWLTNHKINSINKTIIVLEKELSSLQDINNWITNLSLNFEKGIVTSAKQVFIDLGDSAVINKNYLKKLKRLVAYIDNKLAKNNNLSKEKVLTKILRKKIILNIK